MGLLFVQRIAAWRRNKGIFRRERTPTETRPLGIAVYQGGLSYGKSGEAVGVSRQAVKDWFDRAASYFRSLRCRRRKRVAADERGIHLPDGDAYLWAAVDLESGEVIALMVSRGRSGLEALAFLEKVRRMCADRMPRIFIDGGEWYPWVLGRAGFDRWIVVAIGPLSAIEGYSPRWTTGTGLLGGLSISEQDGQPPALAGGLRMGSQYAEQLKLTVSVDRFDRFLCGRSLAALWPSARTEGSREEVRVPLR